MGICVPAATQSAVIAADEAAYSNDLRVSRLRRCFGITANTSCFVGHCFEPCRALPCRPDIMTSSPYTTSGSDADVGVVTSTAAALATIDRVPATWISIWLKRSSDHPCLVAGLVLATESLRLYRSRSKREVVEYCRLHRRRAGCRQALQAGKTNCRVVSWLFQYAVVMLMESNTVELPEWRKNRTHRSGGMGHAHQRQLRKCVRKSCL